MCRNVFILALIFVLTSCQPEGRVFVEHQDLSPNLEWVKKDIRKFNVPITDKSIPYDLKISFRYATGFQFRAANIELTEISPSGKKTVIELPLTVRSDNGDYIGEPGLDIWDSEHLIESEKKYEETGTYQYIIKHIMPKDKMHYAMEIGVILDKSVN